MWELVLVSLGLGVGLAMDACAVSMSNGMNEPQMRPGKALAVAGTFGLFQGLMPMLGWLCVTLIVEQFVRFGRWIPYISLVLLTIIGGKMIFDGVRSGREEQPAKRLTAALLLVQAFATSVDALSTGFSLVDIAGTVWWKALLSAGIIAFVTAAICLPAVYLGKKFGARLGNKAQILGGCILIAIGLEIFISGVLQ